MATVKNLKIERKFGKKNTQLVSLLMVGLISIALVSAAWLRVSGRILTQRLSQDGPVLLSVPPLAQSQGTSCGEAVIAMAYNHAYPAAPISETDVIQFARANGYFTEDEPPYTSPANMVKITRNYTSDYDSGNVRSADEGLGLLISKLKEGDPVIIDVLTYLDDPSSDAHFILVTGVSPDPNEPGLITIYYNNPLTGRGESAPWDGENGIWHAWQNNPDPGGYGWWLVIPKQ